MEQERAIKEGGLDTEVAADNKKRHIREAQVAASIDSSGSIGSPVIPTKVGPPGVGLVVDRGGVKAA